jgi:ribosomal peptide maturation radical SAM protein 1
MDTVCSSSGTCAPIALVNPPFGSIFTPSIQLGLLKALCARDGLEVEDVYANVEFASVLGLRVYNSICYVPGPQTGEWLFGECAFGAEVPAQTYLDRFQDDLQMTSFATGLTLAELLHLRQTEMPRLVGALAAELAKCRVLAITSTFQQNVAALAIARAVKTIRPDVQVVLGGSNMHGVMGQEFFRVFEFVDYVVTGEADHIVSPLFRSLVDGERPPPLDGVLSRHPAPSETSTQFPIFSGEMDSLPIPDYASYFAAMRRAGFVDNAIGYPISIPFESSRGCWWGAKHHCTFCGLNTVGMSFRAKSPERVGHEVEALQKAYGIHRFDATDNIIARQEELLARLRRLEPMPDFFYEIKSNIGPRDVESLARAGIRRVQPGIESLSTRVLQLMKKGVTGLQNINALRWLATFDVMAEWNVLYGFPEEEPADYAEQASIVPHIVHLSPPGRFIQIRLDRFSPNFEHPEMRAKFEAVTPSESYAFIYPQSVDLDRAAYHFHGKAKGALTAEDLRPLEEAIERWRRGWGREFNIIPFLPPPEDRPRLEYRRADSEEGVVIDGRRTPNVPERIVLPPPEAALLEALLARPVPLASVLRKVGEKGHGEAVCCNGLDRLRALGLVLVDKEMALALPLTALEDPITKAHLRERMPLPQA